MSCIDSAAYDSQMLADNSAWLHGVAFPDCLGVEAVPCDGHFHVVHVSSMALEMCRTVRRPRLYRPHKSHGRRATR